MLKTENTVDLEEIRKGFEMFDVEQAGKISLSELIETYDAMNLKNKNPFIYNLISSLSEENDEVSIDELISCIDEKLSDSHSREGLNLIFDSLCEPNEDTLTLSTLPPIAKLEDKLTEKELRYLIERAQMGGEEINFDEFFQIISENNPNEGDNNGMPGSKFQGRGNQPSQQVYRKKASNKNSNENSKINTINNKTKIKNENVEKNSEDIKSKIYDADDINEKKSKRNQRISSNNNSNKKMNYNENNNTKDLKKNDRNRFNKESSEEKEDKNISGKKSANKTIKDDDEDEKEKKKKKKIYIKIMIIKIIMMMMKTEWKP